jgi:thioredoxin 2
LLKVDTEAEPALAQRFSIRSIPTLAIFQQGKEIARVAGAMTSGQFLQWVKSYIK